MILGAFTMPKFDYINFPRCLRKVCLIAILFGGVLHVK